MRVEFCRVKKHTNCAFCVLFILALIAYCIASPFAMRALRGVIADEKGIKTIVIDAGHGGADGGVVGKKSGVEEKTLNLIISNYLGEMLKGCGFQVVFTRTNDTMYSFEGISGNLKRADMYKRGEIINRANPDAIVSIHMNFYSMPTRRGAQVFYSKNNHGSLEFATFVQNALNEQINANDSGRTYSALCAQKYLLECNVAPSIIVECGFLSNIADEYNLQNTAYQQKIAFVLCGAICDYLG